MTSEYCKLEPLYPSISFSENPAKRDKQHSLLQLECMPVIPRNYQRDLVLQYKQCYTWSRKIHEANQAIGMKSILINGFPLFDNYSWLASFIPWEERRGISLMCRHRGPTHPIDFSPKRLEVFNNLTIDKACFGVHPYGGQYYGGRIGQAEQDFWPSSLAKLKMLNQFKFNLCFENCYHSVFSYDYLTEKLQDCFRSKTIPVYCGCWNIEELVPPELFIDYRQFKNDSELNDYLINFPTEKAKRMVEKAFEWVKDSKYGDVADLCEIFDNNEKNI